jgi:hypothetical protein
MTTTAETTRTDLFRKDTGAKNTKHPDLRILITPLVSANSSYSMETLLTEKS